MQSHSDRLLDLQSAYSAWVTETDPGPLRLWIGRELSAEGLPIRLPVESWGPCLNWLLKAEFEEPKARPMATTGRVAGPCGRTVVAGLFRRVVQVSRPDGSTIFGGRGRDKLSRARLVAGATRVGDPGYLSVIARWFPESSVAGGSSAAPPLPTIRGEDRPLAVLRPDWTAESDWVAVDHRDPLEPPRLEVAGDGLPWLSGDWSAPGLTSRPKVTAFSTGAFADAVEWSYRDGATRVTRTAVLLRYRRVALIAQAEDGPPLASGLRLPIAPGVSAGPVAGMRCVALARSRKGARLIPIGLPPLPYETDRGSFRVDGSEAVLNGAGDARRRWLPLVVAWGRPPTHWRPLTVTERSKTCPASVAFGARLAWGPGEDGLLIYRSLAKPALRTVLGHQTRARFLIARFTPEGNVVPLLSLD